MASNIWLIAADGVNTVYFLSGLTGKYTGSGTPWTTQANSPFVLANNDATGNVWTAQAAQTQAIYGGGPPYRIGASLIAKGWGNVTETVGLQIRATTHDNAVFLLRRLRQVLNTALFTLPCRLAVQPDGATNVAYYEIYHADVQELPNYIWEKANNLFTLRVAVTWTRSAFGGLLTTAETAISAQTFANTGTGTPDNVVGYNTMSGDLIHEGQPLNVVFAPANVAGRSLARLYLASYFSRTYSTVAGAPFSTSSTTGVTFYTHTNWNATSVLTNRGIKPRQVLRCSSAPSSNLQLRIRMFFAAASLGVPFYTGPWFTPLASSWYVDCGTFPTDVIRRSKDLTSQSIIFQLQGRSTNGSSASISPTYLEQLLYYDWCRLDQGTAGLLTTDGTNYLLVDQFAEQSQAALLPHYPGLALSVLTTTPADEVWTVRGTLPRYYEGAGLYAAWQDQNSTTPADLEHTTTRQATVTVTHAPLYRTLRGAL